MILAIDPGPATSGYCYFADGVVKEAGEMANDDLLECVSETSADSVAIEMIASYGMAVGKEVFETCLWIGRFMQASPVPVSLVYRKDVKIHLCGSTKAKDSNIRQALIDLLGKPGTKKKPGPTYGVTGDAWSALAVAVCATQ